MVDAMVNDYVNSEIVCTLAALGYTEDNEYYKGDDCLECLKDLIRFLRVDDATCEIRRQLGRSQAVEKDLIPLLSSCTPKEHDIFDVCIRLMVNLTQPAMICFGKVPKEKMERHWFIEVTSHLQSYKEAFAEREIMTVIGRELGRLLQLEWDNREEEDTLLIERILLLLRNVLHVPADPKAEKRTDEDATIHDQVLWNLHANGVDDLILYVASSPDESRWCMHALEIISHMLREQKADIVAKTAVRRTRKEQEEDTKELEIMYEREKASKNSASQKGIRHSNFGGTYYMQNLKALDDENKLLYHKPVQRAKNISFDFGKTAPRKRKAEMHAKEQETDRKSTLSVRTYLKDFCLQFLEHAYNPLMNTVKDNLKHSRAQENDESYYLWAMRFFMEFNRHHQFNVSYISETLNVATFQYIIMLQTKFFDNLISIKDEKVEWGRRLHLSVRAYQELIQHIALLQVSDDETLRDSAKIIKENLFYVSEFRDIFIVMLKKFDPRLQTKSFLRDLIEAFHIFLKLLEAHCKNKGHVIVQQKKRKANRKKKRTIPRTEPIVPLTAEQKEERWEELSADLSSFFQNEEGALPPIVNPFDPVSDVPEEDQKTRCLSSIQRNIRGNSFGEGLALLRAAREIWPNSSFGENDIDSEGEFMCFYEIFRMDVPVTNDGGGETEATGDQEDEMTDPETEEIQAVQVRETEFDFETFLKKLASPLLLQSYCWLLAWYRENSVHINHYIVKMLHRIAVDLKLQAMLFQLSLFTTFRKVFSDPAASKYKELVKFSKYILAKFFELLPNNPTLYAELIFWKSPAECYEITEGYGSLAHRDLRRSGHSWTFEEEEELKQLYDEFKDTEDLVENILNAINNEFRTRRQVVGKLIILGLVENKEILKKKPVNKNAWPEEEQNELRNLFEEFKDSEDIVGGILMSMTNKTRSRRQVINQLVKLNIVEDRSILRKKRAKKPRKRNNNEYEKEDGGSDEEDGGGDEEPDAETSDDENDESDLNDEMSTEFSNMLAVVKNSEHVDQLEWIKSRLNGAADDRDEDDDWQPLPLVTLTEESELALRDKSFQKLLKKIGLASPTNEQERYWRIPDNLSPNQLRKAVADLEADTPDVPEKPSDESGKSKVNPKRQKLAELAATLKSSNKRGERARKRKERENTSSKKDKKRKKRKSVDGDHEDGSSHGNSDEESDVEENEESREPRAKKTPKRKRVRMQDSDDSDEDALHIHIEENEGENHDDHGSIPDEEIITEQETGHDVENKRGQPQGLEADSEDSDDDHVLRNGGRPEGQEEDESDNSGQEGNAGRKRGRSEDEESESSDDDDLDIPLIRTKRARQAVLDDDDDEE